VELVIVEQPAEPVGDEAFDPHRRWRRRV
jgi:hypothetical protein